MKKYILVQEKFILKKNMKVAQKLYQRPQIVFAKNSANFFLRNTFVALQVYNSGNPSNLKIFYEVETVQ